MKKKFTLIELLVIVAILAILASIIVPSIKNVFHKAKKFDCMSNLREVSMGYNLYRKDYMKYPQNEWFLDDFGPVYKYIKNTAVFNCKGENDINVSQESQLDGETPYMRNIDMTDLPDWEQNHTTVNWSTSSSMFTGNGNSGNSGNSGNTSNGGNNAGNGNNPYGLDPSNPNFDRWIAGKLQTEGLHDKDISYHGSFNFIIMDAGSYMPIYTKELLWELKSNRDLVKND